MVFKLPPPRHFKQRYGLHWHAANLLTAFIPTGIFYLWLHYAKKDLNERQEKEKLRKEEEKKTRKLQRTFTFKKKSAEASEHVLYENRLKTLEQKIRQLEEALEKTNSVKTEIQGKKIFFLSQEINRKQEIQQPISEKSYFTKIYDYFIPRS
eukprot:maker-scaffold_9-snap-gene-8.60-mRNA-1 protein AED:0.29 eAED:0.29 QI:58/1/1/1/0/0/2/525/151